MGAQEIVDVVALPTAAAMACIVAVSMVGAAGGIEGPGTAVVGVRGHQ